MTGYTLAAAGSHRGEFIAMFAMYCREFLKEDPGVARFDFTEAAENYLNMDSAHPYFIHTDGRNAGFVVFSDETDDPGDADCHTYIAELFVLPEYRKRGIASRVVCDYPDSREYDTGFCFCFVRGSYAGKFRLRLLTDKGYRYAVSREDRLRDFVHIHLR